jgi:membrane protease YdiL (CAAX protease family)
MENIFIDRKGLYSFTMLIILAVLMIVVGLAFSPLFMKLTVPALFGIKDLEAFLKTPSEQATHAGALIYVQAVYTVGVFLIPVFLYHSIFRYDMVSAMGLRRLPRVKYWLLAIGIMLVAAIFSQLLVQINTAVKLPAQWQSLRSGQAEAERMMKIFFSDQGMSRFALLTLVVALLPALCEEFCFRGTMQNILAQTNLGPIGAIIFSGLFFSLVHSEFDNFLAIWCMGIILGALYYYSGSIWVSVWAHFLYNFLMVASQYALMRGLIHEDVTSSDSLPIYLTLPAGVLMICGLVVLARSSGKRGVSANL